MKPGSQSRRKKLERPAKAYDITQCGLYGIKGLRQLCDVLKWTHGSAELDALANGEKNYRVFPLNKGTAKERWVQAPSDALDIVQARIATLLRRVAPPDYRHSGVRERSFITNAAQHANGLPAVKIDVAKYYPSTSFGHIVQLFRDRLRCASDVAIVLAKLCCFECRCLPTGGRHSEIVAFMAHKDLFDSWDDRAKSRGGAFGLYVDDAVMSMECASSGDLRRAGEELRSRGLKLNEKKSRVMPKDEPKTITGVLVTADSIRAPQVQHQRLKAGMEAFKLQSPKSPERKAAALSVLGRMDHMAQIDDRFELRASELRKRVVAEGDLS